MKKRILSTVTAAVMLTASANAVFAQDNGNGVKALSTSSKIYIDGKETAFDAYNIYDNNYFKLRDIANAISGTSKQFDVSWNEEEKSVSLISDTPYTKVGGEMVLGNGTEKTAVDGVDGVFVDGNWVEMKAYNIEDNNYFMLRDIGKAFDFNVYWDGDTNSVMIETDMPYMGEDSLTEEDIKKLAEYAEYALSVPRYAEFEDVADFGAINDIQAEQTIVKNSDVGEVFVYLYNKEDVTQAMIDKYYVELIKTYTYMSPITEENAKNNTVNFINYTPRIITTMQDDEYFAVGITKDELPEETAQKMLMTAFEWTSNFMQADSSETVE